MNTLVTFFKNKAALIVTSAAASLPSPVSYHLTKQCQNGARFFSNVTCQLNMLTQTVFCPDHYDPYLRKEHAEYIKMNDVEESSEIAKTRLNVPRQSVAIAALDGMVCSVSACASKIFIGCKHRLVKSFEEAVKRKAAYQAGNASFASLIGLPESVEYSIQQSGERVLGVFFPEELRKLDEDALLSSRFFPPLGVEAYRQAFDDDNNSWGIVASETLTVQFIVSLASSCASSHISHAIAATIQTIECHPPTHVIRGDLSPQYVVSGWKRTYFINGIY
ncbi:hypothetical protein BX666DRAFT_1942030 [Dichotomocladium elegans]|nr:hypothetical protein BX666DRAFT_1942030 [Dichotomocladium elegans]